MQTRQNIKVVLMADDDEDDHLLVRDAFAKLGMPIELRWVSDGEQLMDYLFRRRKYEDAFHFPQPSLILLDLNMPKKDGREALAEIKAHPVLKQIPVAILTTSRDITDMQYCHEMGVDSFLTKPNNFSALLDALKGIEKHWTETVELPSSTPFMKPEHHTSD